MPTTYELLTWMAVAGVVGVVVALAIAFSVAIGTPARTGEPSGGEPEPPETPTPSPVSIERSATSSTASITVQANPARPLVFTAEPASGSARLVKLTVVYEQSLDDLELATLRSVDSDSKQDELPLGGVDDERWINKVNQARGNL